MNWELLWLFIVLNVLNVVIQTVKSIATIKCGKWSAALINAIAYGLYTVVVVYTVCDLELWIKVAVVAVANLIGVFVVKLFEEKARKDKLWKVEATVKHSDFYTIKEFGELGVVPYNYVDIGKYVLVNFYCSTQKESAIVRELLNKYNAKYFVSESKTL